MLGVCRDFIEESTFVESLTNDYLGQNDLGNGRIATAWGCDGRQGRQCRDGTTPLCPLFCYSRGLLWFLRISDLEREQLLGCEMS